MTMDGDELMTPREVAAALACCTETVLRHVRAGELPAVRFGRGNNVVRVLASDLRAFVASRRQVASGAVRPLRLRPRART